MLDTSGNVYTTGLFRDTVDFNPGLGTTYLTSAGDADVFVQKLDTSGNFQWAKSFGGGFSWDVGISIALDASGNVFTTGVFQGTADFDPGPGTAFLYSGGFEDVFIQKLDSSGNFLWANSFGGSFVDHGNSIAVDASGNVYSTGSYESEIGERRFIFIQKLDASGNVLWIKSFGGTLSNSGYSIVVDASGNIYTTGVFIGIVDFDPGAGIANLTSAGSSSYDVFVQKLDASGNFQWAKSFGGSYSDEGRSIALDASGNIYTTGVFRGSADFHLSAGTANLSSAGAADVFVYKMNPSTVGLLENTFAQQIKIFPNPTAGTFIIDLGDDYKSTLITISDALGRVVSASKFSSTSAIQLSLDEPPGVYFIEIVSDDHSARLKLIKE